MNSHWQAFFSRANALMDRLEQQQSMRLQEPDWSASAAFRYRKRGGIVQLVPVQHVANIGAESLREIDTQAERILRNTAQFVAGFPANNVLLTGARGTGKSSLVRACLHAYANHGLRLIEVDKAELVDIQDIVDVVADRPEKFILFCDDLSFEDGEHGYKALKSALDGSVAAVSANTLIYATSNRRHLLPERFADNLAHAQAENGEIHPGEGVEEKISLSERFGLWISFYPFDQNQYLAIVGQWLTVFGFDAAAIQALRPDALVWALERGSRSGRVAWQFARDCAGRKGLE